MGNVMDVEIIFWHSMECRAKAFVPLTNIRITPQTPLFLIGAADPLSLRHRAAMVALIMRLSLLPDLATLKYSQ